VAVSGSSLFEFSALCCPCCRVVCVVVSSGSSCRPVRPFCRQSSDWDVQVQLVNEKEVKGTAAEPLHGHDDRDVDVRLPASYSTHP
jgi:hypothetical protein